MDSHRNFEDRLSKTKSNVCNKLSRQLMHLQYLTEGRFVMNSRASVSVPACADFEVERTIDSTQMNTLNTALY